MIDLMYTGSEFMYGQDATTRTELRQLGLLDGSPEPHLTAKGRDWLKELEDIETHEVSEYGEQAADLVLSTNGLFR
ncbi:MAG: hypothetical protein KY391_04770 [Actinobacteria bacterium]|nr:hypothetical protein [Actinomycetota bacterium]